jgi:hypothetical protein
VCSTEMSIVFTSCPMVGAARQSAAGCRCKLVSSKPQYQIYAMLHCQELGILTEFAKP